MPGEQTPPTINPYAAPAVAVDAAAAAAASTLDLTRDEVWTFVGKKNAYYWRVWQRATPEKALVLKFNWAALLFNFSWLLYRKMYREFWFACAALLGLGFSVGVVARLADAKLDGFNNVLNLGIAVTVGTLGNGLYLRKARREVTAARAEETDPERRMFRLASRGGTSWLAVILGAVGGIVLTLLFRR